MALTWCGVPETSDGKWRGNTGATVTRSDVCIVGVPYDAGRSAADGQDQAPFAIRRLETFDSWSDVKLGDLSKLKVVDLGDLNIDHRAAAMSLQSHEEKVREIWNNTDLLLSLGGDHSITSWLLGIYNGNHDAPIVIHMDAHTDTWPYDDPNGTGMPTHDSWVSWAAEEGLYHYLFQIGVRALGPDVEVDKNIPARNVTRGEWTQKQIFGLITWIKNTYPGQKVYLSIDMDVVDPVACPGVAYPEPGGWPPYTLLRAIEELVGNLDVIGVDIVELTPALDRGDLSVRLAHRSALAVVRGLKAKQQSTESG